MPYRLLQQPWSESSRSCKSGDFEIVVELFELMEVRLLTEIVDFLN